MQLDYYEVSAKTGESIEEGIKKLVKKLILRCTDIEENDDNSFESSTADSAYSIDIEERKNCTIF